MAVSEFTPDESFARRFWSKVNKTETCWLWNAAIGNHGYGVIGHEFRGTITAHRASWIMHNGSIPMGMFVCHKCDVRLCVNPDHLFLGTPSDNTIDAANKGLMPRGTRRADAKLREADIPEIRRLYKSGQSFPQIAERYGVQRATINCVIRGKSWKHVR